MQEILIGVILLFVRTNIPFRLINMNGTLKSVKNERKNTSREKWALFRKSTNLSAIFDPKRWILWKSLNPTNKPLITAREIRLITLQTVANTNTPLNPRLIIVADHDYNITDILLRWICRCRCRHILSHKQSVHKLCESNITLSPKVSLILILLGCGFVARLVFSLI